MFSGQFDSFSPPAVVEAQAARLPMAWTIEVPGQTHNTLGFAECAITARNHWAQAPTTPPDVDACRAGATRRPRHGQLNQLGDGRQVSSNIVNQAQVWDSYIMTRLDPENLEPYLIPLIYKQIGVEITSDDGQVAEGILTLRQGLRGVGGPSAVALAVLLQDISAVTISATHR